MTETKDTPSALVLPEKLKPIAQRAVPVSEVNPFALVQMAVQRGDSLETITKLVDLAERMQANIARNAFNEAFAAFKAEEAVRIVKGTLVTDGPLKGKKYDDLFDIVVAVTEPLAKHGLSHSWKLTKDEPTWMEVTCILKHSGGHFETDAQGGAPDTGPGRNAIQARRSTRTYLEKSTLKGVTGLAASADDDDGGGGKKEVVKMTAEHQAAVQALCDEIKKGMAATVAKSYKAASLAEIPDSEFDSIVRRLQAAKNAKAEKAGAKS